MDVKITDNTDKVLQALQEQIATSLEAVGLQAEGDVKTKMAHYSPKPIVDTGRLMNSITHEVEGDTAIVGTNVEYAPYVELGTSKTQARPFLGNTIQENKNKYKEIIEEYMKDKS